jgi:hypothetical protein
VGTILPSPGGFPRGRPASHFFSSRSLGFAGQFLGPDRFYTGDMAQTTNTNVVGTVCSAKGCREPATMALKWNNPSLHTPDRRKTWLACAAHQQSLSGFLEARGFLREVVPFP